MIRIIPHSPPETKDSGLNDKLLVILRDNVYLNTTNYGGPIGPPAMINCELRQARKGATVTIDSCAGMWLVGLPPFLDRYYLNYQ